MNSFSVIAILVLSASLFADGQEYTYVPLGDCPPPENFENILDWVKQIDNVKRAPLRQPEPNDYVSKFGFIIKDSCFQGPRKTRRQEIIDRYEEIAAKTMSQAAQCFRIFGFPEITAVIPALRENVFNCSANDNPTNVASESEFYEVKYDSILKKVLLPDKVTVQFSHDYDTNINIANDRDLKGSTGDYASHLFHEMLHTTAANNSSDHNNISKKKVYGCENSLFSDRVYFMQAVCFPQSHRGKQFYGNGKDPNSPVNCPGICKDALTKIDPKINEKYENVYGGDALIAKPYKPKEAELDCGRIRDISAARATFAKERLEVEQGRSKLQKAYVNFIGKPEFEKTRSSLVSFFQLILGKPMRWHDRDENLAAMNALRADLESERAKICKAPVPADREPICRPNGEPLKSELDRGFATVRSRSDHDFVIDRFLNDTH